MARNQTTVPAKKRLLGENLVTSGQKPRTAQVRLCTRARSSPKFLCFDIFALDRLASGIYAATATPCLT